MSLPFTIRRADLTNESERNFILKSWAGTIRRLEPYAAMEQDVFGFHHQAVQAVIKGAGVLVACNVDNPDHLYGFLVADEARDAPTVHFAYTVRTFRGNGIATALIRRAIPQFTKIETVYTQPAGRGVSGALRKKLRLKWNPFLLYQRADEAMHGIR